MVFSSWGCLSSVVWQAKLAVPKRKDDAFTPSENLVFCGFTFSEVVEAGSVDLDYLFGIRIALCFLGLSLICDSEYLFTMKVLMLSLN